MNRINVITLGVRDIKASLRFYRDGMGFKTSVDEDNPDIVFFENNGSKLALYPRQLLAEDIDEDTPPTGAGFPGITLAISTSSQEEVDAVIAAAEQAGANIVKKPQKVFWGGYSGYFTDPDGYYWEVVYSKNFKFDEYEMLV